MRTGEWLVRISNNTGNLEVEGYISSIELGVVTMKSPFKFCDQSRSEIRVCDPDQRLCALTQCFPFQMCDPIFSNNIINIISGSGDGSTLIKKWNNF